MIPLERQVNLSLIEGGLDDDIDDLKDFRVEGLGNPSDLWVYFDGSGKPCLAEVRYEMPDGTAEFRPWKKNARHIWVLGAPSTRPLFELSSLEGDPERPVLIVESESTVVDLDNSGGPFDRYDIITWYGGAAGAAQTDWWPLAGRDVVLWQNAGEAGARTMKRVAALCDRIGARSVAFAALPSGLPDGWSLSDDLPEEWPENWDSFTARALAKARSIDDDILGPLIDPGEDWAGAPEPPPQEWLVKGWLPVGGCTLFAARGGTGKTLLAQQLGTSLALGRSWLGQEITACKVLMLTCEDDRDELHRRQIRINADLSITMEDLADKVILNARDGMENKLAKVHKDGELRPTALFESVRRTVEKTGTRLLILDNMKQMLPVPAWDSDSITKFINLVAGMMKATKGAALLVHHPSKAEDSQFGGATAWEDACRGRWFLGHSPGDGDGVLALTLEKSNRTRPGATISLRYARCNTLHPVTGKTGDGFAILAANRADEEAFLAALDAMTEEGRPISDSPNSGRYAPKAMFGRPETQGMSKARIKAAMERLFQNGEIVANAKVGSYSNRSPIYGIARRGPDDSAQECTEVPDKPLKSLHRDVAQECTGLADNSL